MNRAYFSMAFVLPLVVLSLSTNISATGDGPDSGLHLLATAFQEFVPRGPAGEVTLVSDKECELAAELAGTWELDRNLAKELAPKMVEERDLKPNEIGPMTRFKISLEDDNSSSLDKLRSWMKLLAKDEAAASLLFEFEETCRRVLAVGEIEVTGSKRSFAVVQWRGNLMMLVFRRNGLPDPMYISMACDRKGDNDYLFMREDHGNTGPYKRVVEQDK